MAASIGDIAKALSNIADDRWRGWNFLVACTDKHQASVTLPVIGINEIVFPTVTASLTTVPTLSTHKEYVVSGWDVGELSLKAIVTRNANFFALIDRQNKVLSGNRDYEGFDLVIACNGLGAMKPYKDAKFPVPPIPIPPITVYFALGCQATKFIPASANTNNTTSMPLDELKIQVSDFYRPNLELF